MLLTKCLRPLPEKFHGLADTETRYRQRYLDCIMNERTRATFALRSRIVQELRGFFQERDFLEVETPMMHRIPGGANAEPFVTHHNALDLPLYLRVAPELFLKRLTIGGFRRLRAGVRDQPELPQRGALHQAQSRIHHAGVLLAYRDYRDLMDLTEELLEKLDRDLFGDDGFSYQGERLRFRKGGFERLTLAESLVRYSTLTERQVEDEDRLRALLQGRGAPVAEAWGLGKLQMEVFEAEVERKLAAPTFITEHPAEVSPLSPPQ